MGYGETVERLRTVPSRAVLAAAAVTLSAGFIELGGAWLGHSLFLTADAVHLLAHLLIYGALLVPRQAWGGRGEQVGTLGVLMVLELVALGIIGASVRDLLGDRANPDARALLLSVVGLCANGVSAWLLQPPSQARLSIRVALVHELADGFMTILALLGSVLVYFLGWRWVDPVLSLGVGAWLLLWAGRWLFTWRLSRV
jgi:cobalt-zinc-cadmium efflux system protein